jgi:hypothetical protein
VSTVTKATVERRHREAAALTLSTGHKLEDHVSRWVAGEETVHRVFGDVAQALADIEAAAEARVRQTHVVPLEQEALDLRALERLVRRHMRAGTFHPADERLFGAVLGSIDRTRREHPLPATEEPKETT